MSLSEKIRKKFGKNPEKIGKNPEKIGKNLGKKIRKLQKNQRTHANRFFDRGCAQGDTASLKHEWLPHTPHLQTSLHDLPRHAVMFFSGSNTSSHAEHFGSWFERSLREWCVCGATVDATPTPPNRHTVSMSPATNMAAKRGLSLSASMYLGGFLRNRAKSSGRVKLRPRISVRCSCSSALSSKFGPELSVLVA